MYSRKIVLLLFFLLSKTIFSQNIKVTYIEKLEFSESKLDSIKKNYPRDFVNSLLATYSDERQFILSVDSVQSNYKFIPKLDNSINDSPFKVTLTPSGNIIKHRNDSIYYELTEFPDKYIIEDLLPNFFWKIDESKSMEDVLGYKVFVANTKIKELEISALFTTDIPINDGPDFYWGLPGLILYLEAFDKESSEYQIIEAQKIEKSKGNVDNSVPKKYRKISRKSYEVVLKNRK